MINKAVLVGNVGRDPEVKTLEGGSKLAKFTLATSERYKNKDGQKVTETEWHNITAWGKNADVIELFVKKGNLLYIEGKIKTRSWEKDGEKKYMTEIKLENFQMLGKKEEAEDIEVIKAPVVEEKEKDDLPF